MDPHTLDKLEFDRVRAILGGYANCSLGRGLAARITPSRNARDIELWLEQLRQMRDLCVARGLPPFAGVHDVREMVRRSAPPSPLEPPDYAAIGETLAAIAVLRRYFADLPSTADRLAGLAARLGDFSAIASRIAEVIDERGQVRDDASEKLRKIRIDMARVTEEVRRVFDRMLRRPDVTKYLQYANATFHNDRMVLPLRSEQRGRVQGIIHRSSDSGQTLFVEPSEAVAMNNTLIELRQDEQREIGRLLWQLAHLIHLNEKEILRSLDAAAVVDLIAAKVRYANAFDMCVPTLSADRTLRLSGARHPLLLEINARAGPGSMGVPPVRPAASRGAGASRDASRSAPAPSEGATLTLSLSLEGRGGNDPTAAPEVDAVLAIPPPVRGESAKRALQSVVPIDVRLGEDFDLLMVTGPNTGGKTAALKSIGLLALMALAGLPVPAANGATVPLLDDVLIDVGDEQSLQQSLSTFSSHLARVLEVLERATPSTLVLLDELGAGTDPDEGAALGNAIVDELLARGCLTIVTTHLGALKAVAFQRERAENAAVQFDLQTLRPTYELRIGEPGESNALHIAQRLGLPQRVLDRAREHLAGHRRALSDAIRGTLAARRKAEEARKTAEEAARRSAEQADALQRQRTAIEEEQRRFARWTERIKSLRPGDRVRLTRFERDGVIVRVKITHQTAVVSVGAMEYEVPFTEIGVDGAQ